MEVIDQNGCIGFAAHHSGGGDNSGGGGGNVFPGAFEPEVDSEGAVKTWKNCYYQIGGFTRYVNDISNSFRDGFVCARINSPGFTVSFELVNYENLESLEKAQKDLSNFLIPLFILKNSKIEVDLRRMPNTGIPEPFTED